MKYDDPLVLDDNEVHSMILKHIKPGSLILEFGAASGRMTKLLKNLGCSVYIVEYEKKAYKLAKQYAVSGICGDIMRLKWFRKWKRKEFDYILFVDVLEHLTDPNKILTLSRSLLKKNGSVFISVPNIAHNDIWIKLYQNHFDYTSIGILDDTHVHFWTKKSLKTLAENNGFFLKSVEYKFVPTQMTEQNADEEIRIPNALLDSLREREDGEVYQFVLELSTDIRESCSLPSPTYIKHRAWLYYDKGYGYNQKCTTNILGERIEKEKYSFCICMADLNEVRKVRFDPVENQNCLIRVRSIKKGKTNIGSLSQNKWIPLYSNDPSIELYPEVGEIDAVIDVDLSITHIEEELDKTVLSYKENGHD